MKSKKIGINRSMYRSRCKDFGVNNPAGAQAHIVLDIPADTKCLVPQDTTIRMDVKMTNFSSSTFLNGSIQNMFRNVRIYDGHGTVLEEINRYGLINSMLFEVHVPEHIKYTKFQSEGVFKHRVPHKLSGTRAVFDNHSGGTNVDFKTVHTDGNDLGKDIKDLVNQNEIEDTNPTENWNFQRYIHAPKYAAVGTERELHDTSKRHYFRLHKKLATGETQTLLVKSENAKYGNNPYTFDYRGVETDNDEIDLEDNATSLTRVTYEGYSEFTPWWDFMGKKWANNEYVTFTFHLGACGIFNTTKLWPLWISKGLRIELELGGLNEFSVEKFFARSEQITTPAYQGKYFQNRQFPRQEVSIAEVMYTAIDVDDAVINKIENDYKRQGLYFIVPSYKFVQYDKINKVPSTTAGSIATVKLDVKENFTMLNRIYSFLRRSWFSSGNYGSLETISRDFYKPIRLNNVVERYWDYNRVYIPNWSKERFAPAESLYYMDLNRNLNTLNDYSTGNYSLGQFIGTANDNQSSGTYFIDTLETDPDDYLSGTTTDNRKLTYNLSWITQLNDASSEVLDLVLVYQYYKVVRYRAGEPPSIME